MNLLFCVRLLCAFGIGATANPKSCHGDAACHTGEEADEASLLQHKSKQKHHPEGSSDAHGNYHPHPSPAPQPTPPLPESLFLTYGHLAYTWEHNDEKCGIVGWAAKYAMPSEAEKDGFKAPIRVGTEENIQLGSQLKRLGVDFTGIWWIRDNLGLLSTGPRLISFAGAHVKSLHRGTDASQFPVSITLGSDMGHYAFGNSMAGRLNLQAYDGNEPTKDMNVIMEGEGYGSMTYTQNVMEQLGITNIDLQKKSEDEMEITHTTVPSRPVNYNTETYTRIVKADGTPTNNWHVFLDQTRSHGQLGAAELVSMYSQDFCLRECQSGGDSCETCKGRCRGHHHR